jgi:hypothetical protein
MKKILHLCADIGSDSRFYDLDPDYEVIKIGKDFGVENYIVSGDVYGIIANPPCTEFSAARKGGRPRNVKSGMYLVDICLEIIEKEDPYFWVIENPATGGLVRELGIPDYIYQPWQYGSPWTKKTGLWGNFNIPIPLYSKWEDVPKNSELYIRPGRLKPSLAFLHKNDAKKIKEFDWAVDMIKSDMDLRSMCSQGFARAFYEANK